MSQTFVNMDADAETGQPTVMADETPETTLKIERYEDIFSDFDMRPYSRRALSVDFLEELRRASFEKEADGLDLVLNIPAAKRDMASEAKIKERLKDHFRKHYELLLEERRGIRRRGWLMVASGAAAMLVASFVHFGNANQNIFFSFMLMLLEPAAWFLLWEGMDLIIFVSKKAGSQLLFYKKMSRKRNNIRFAGF